MSHKHIEPTYFQWILDLMFSYAIAMWIYNFEYFFSVLPRAKFTYSLSFMNIRDKVSNVSRRDLGDFQFTIDNAGRMLWMNELALEDWYIEVLWYYGDLGRASKHKRGWDRIDPKRSHQLHQLHELRIESEAESESHSQHFDSNGERLSEWEKNESTCIFNIQLLYVRKPYAN